MVKKNMPIFIFFTLKIVTLTTLIYLCTCVEQSVAKNTNSLLNFRKLIEETSAENNPYKRSSNSNNNFVSFLLENAKEIFSNSDEPNAIFKSVSKNDDTTFGLLSNTVSISTTEQNSQDELIGKIILDLEDMNSNLSKSTLLDLFIKRPTDGVINISDVHNNLSSTEIRQDNTEKSNLNTTEEILILEKKHLAQIDQNVLQLVNSPTLTTVNDSDASSKRSCIACDNIASIDCMDPRHKLISSNICDREDDICYSMHTPFGIVDRGCFNVNHNLSTYVCSCNLCNYISISEMPYIFSEKRDWIENVKELSRTKRLRKSIFKDMSCLRCEVNGTLANGNVLNNANCLEGNINALPLQECASNEICGVRAIRSEGYIWRGCLSRPLYNYWWTLCDTDLCNYDILVSIYNEL